MTLARLITSLSNNRVKAIRALEMRKVRRETGLFVAEGTSILITARNHGVLPETLIMTQAAADHPYNVVGSQAGGLVDMTLAAGREVLSVSDPVMRKLAAQENPHFLLGVFRQRWAEPPPFTTLTTSSVWVVLEEIRDPGNLGTIIRTCDAVGAAGVILVGTCCDAHSRESVRATMGSIFAVPLVRLSREDFLAWRAGWPGDVIGTHLVATDDFRRVDYTGPILLAMGGEGPGLSHDLIRACTRLVKIPMAGQLDSLNLAVATALALYQIRGPYIGEGTSP